MSYEFVESSVDRDVADEVEDVVVFGGDLRVELENGMARKRVVNRPG
jgi:hypothetical protein